MKRLVHKKTQQPIVEFIEQETVFYNRFLEQEMRNIGIMIPHGLRGVYQGKDCIKLEDTEFQRAFKEVYYLTTMGAENFQWQEP